MWFGAAPVDGEGWPEFAGTEERGGGMGGGEGQRGGERPCPEEARRMRRVQGSFYSRLGSGTVPG